MQTPEPAVSARQGLRVAVIGGGPTGLLAAIEAMGQGAETVTVYESRDAWYSRRNVPTLTKESVAKLEELEVYHEIFGGEGLWSLMYPARGTIDSDGKGQVALHVLEEALARKANALGVKIQRDARVRGIEPSQTRKGSRPSTAKLTIDTSLREVRSEEIGQRVRTWTERVPVEVQELADLVIVATGGGASRDPFVTQTLGIPYQELAARDYGFYGLFEHASTTPYELKYYADWFKHLQGGVPARQPESPAHYDEISTIVQRGFALTPFETPLHDYILGFVSGITKDDFNSLHVHKDDSAEVKEQKRKRLRKLAEHIALLSTAGYNNKFQTVLPDERAVEVFEVTIAQALRVVSSRFPVVVVGDAAATPHPRAGSGLNTGIASVGAIGSLVRELQAGTGADQAFARYEASVQRLTTGMVATALNVMAISFDFKVRSLFPSKKAVRAWSRFFKRIHGIEWEHWYETRMELIKSICVPAAKSEQGVALDQAWALLDEVYGVIEKAFEGLGVLEEKLERLETMK